MKKYDTKEKRLKWLNKQGNLVTYKTKTRGLLQLVVKELEYIGEKVRIIGLNGSSRLYDNLDQLLEDFDWDWMEENVCD